MSTESKPARKPRARKSAAVPPAEVAVPPANTSLPPQAATPEEAEALREEVRALRADRIIREANAGVVTLVEVEPARKPWDLLRASPWLLLAIACLVPLFWIVGDTFTELLLWPLAKFALIVFGCYWADRTLHRMARLHWYSLALLPARAGEEAEVTHLRETVPTPSLVWLAIGAWVRRGLMLAGLAAILAKAY